MSRHSNWLLLAASFFAFVCVPAASAQPPVAPDLHGDSLPAGAIARIGTTRLRHQGEVLAVAFSPDGKLLASAGRDGTVRLREMPSGRELRCLKSRSGRTGAVAFSPDGKLLAWGLGDGIIRLTNPATGQEIDQFGGNHADVRSLAFSPDGKLLASGLGNTVYFWDVASGTKIRRIAEYLHEPHSVAFSPDGKVLACGCSHGLKIYDPGTGKEIRKLTDGDVRSAAFSPDGKYLAAAKRNEVCLWEAASGKRLDGPSGEGAAGLAFARDGKVLACAGNSLALVDIRTGKSRSLRTAYRGNAASTVAFSPDGKMLATGSGEFGEDFRVRLWDVTTDKELHPELQEPGGRAGGSFKIAVPADGKTVVTMGSHWNSESPIKTWDAVTGRLLREMEGPNNTSMAISPDGKILASCTRDLKYYQWWILLRDLSTGEVIRKWSLDRAEPRLLAFSPDGRVLASAGWQNALILWDATTGKELRRLRGEKPVLTLAYSPDGKSLLTSSDDPSLAAWDAETGKEVRRLTGHRADSKVYGLAFASDGKLLASSGTDNLLCLWDADSGRLLRKIIRADSSAYLGVVALSPDGKTVVSEGGDKAFCLWDTATGALRQKVSGNRGDVTGALFTPDGKRLITTSNDGTALIWDIAKLPTETAKPAAPPLRSDRDGDPLPSGALARLGSIGLNHGGGSASAAFSPDGKILATMVASNEHQSIRLWDVATGKEVRRLEPCNGWPLQMAFSPDGRVLAYCTHQTIWMWEAATGNPLGKIGQLPHLKCFAFSSDGKTIAAAGGYPAPDLDYRIHLYDLETGARLQHLVGHETPVESVRFSADGKFIRSTGGVLATSDGKTTTIVNGKTLLWDAATGKRIESLPDNRDPFEVFGVSKIKIVAEHGKKLSLRDTVNDRELHVLDATGTNWLLSPDGKLLATSEDKHGIRLWDMVAGKEIRRFQGFQNPNARLLCFSPDGKVLASVASKIRFWDVATGRELLPGPGHLDAVYCMAFSQDGELLVSGGEDKTLRLWETKDGKPIRLVTLDHAVTAVALSADGKRVATGDAGNTVRVWETAELRQTARYSLPVIANQQEPIRIGSVGFSTDGKTLLAGSSQGVIVSWDLESGKQLRELKVSTGPVGFSPDGKFAAHATGGYNRFGEGSVGIWNLTANKQQVQIKGEKGETFGQILFSPDGKFVAGSRCIIEEGHGHLVDHQVRIWEPATGKEVLRIETIGPVNPLAFSPEGNVLITGSGQAWPAGDPQIQFWDLSTGKEIGRQPGHVGAVTALAFSPDGRRFASGSADTTLLIWDRAVIGQARQPWKAAFPTRQPEDWLADLTADDAVKAYKALWTMASMPDPSVALLTKRLRPVPQPDERKIKQWIAELDSPRFEVREKAAAELEKLTELAGPALEEALANRPALEVRQRLEQLLEKREIASSGKDQLLAVRATTLLERIGTPEARKLLRLLAEGAKGARLTEEAKAALQRLNLRPIQEP
jgi:WD40 repeat protein